jgi:agmatine deiminase
MIPDAETTCVALAAVLADRHPAIYRGLRAILEGHGVAVRLLDGVRDIWARDYCPVQVADRGFVQFRYDPDYLRDGHGNLM